MNASTPTTARYRPYSEYKPSGVEWLGHIPNHWVMIALKRTSKRLQAGSTPPTSQEEYYEDGDIPWFGPGSFDGGITLRNPVKWLNKKAIEDGVARLFDPESIMVVSIGATIGKASSIQSRASCNQQITGITFYPERVSSRFGAYYLKSQEQTICAIAPSATLPIVDQNRLGMLPLALPPLHEQQVIAAFLDRETARIDSLIAKKQRQIELLQEKRAALISHAVTKGLDPNVKMKDSGIEWLGQIPEHWAMKRLKFVSTLQTGLTLGKKYNGENLVTRPYLRVANVQDGYLALDTITEIELPPEDANRYELRPGDVLMTEGGDFDKLGRGYVWEAQIPGCLHQNHIFAVRPRQGSLRSDFLAAVLTSSHGKNYFTSTSQQTTNLATTNSTKLLNFPAPLPPEGEQDAILDRIRHAAGHLEALIGRIGSSIERLREYRTALISGAVTGKIDVREEVAEQ